MGSNGLNTSRPNPSSPISAEIMSASAASFPAVSFSLVAEDLCPGKKCFAPLTGERLLGDAVGDGTYARPNAGVGLGMLQFDRPSGRTRDKLTA